MKKTRRILAVLLTMAMMILLITTVGAYNDETYGVWKIRKFEPVDAPYNNGASKVFCITDYTGNETGTLTLPSSVDGYTLWKIFPEVFQKKQFTSIAIPSVVKGVGTYCFCNCVQLKTVSIGIPTSRTGNGITTTYDCGFGEGAFYGCSTLESVTISNMINVPDKCFYGCTSLNEIDLSGYPETIKSEAFANCTGVETISMKKNVTSIDATAFSGCTGVKTLNLRDFTKTVSPFYGFSNLETITVDESNTAFSVDSNCLYNKAKTKLYICPAKTSGVFEIPESVTTISSRAFEKCANITGVSIPDGVATVGTSVFSGCTGLGYVAIPETVTSIKENAFYNCRRLTDIYYAGTEEQWYANIDIASGNEPLLLANVHFESEPPVVTDEYTCGDYIYVVEDGKAIIIDYTGTDTVLTIPSTLDDYTVVGIREAVFQDCQTLTNVTIPDTVTSIGEEAFQGCTSLASIDVPDGVTSIGGGAFRNCTSLTGINIPASVTNIGVDAFDHCIQLETITVDKENSVYYSEGNCLITKNDKEVLAGCKTSVIPNDVEKIGIFAFDRCDGLTSINIPVSVKFIGEAAFEGCTALKDVYYSGSEDDWENIFIDAGNSVLLSATIHFNSPMPTQSTTTTTTATTTATEAQQPIAHAISVSLGSSDKTNAYESEIVTVTADTPAQGLVFDKWVGEGVTFTDETASETTFTMPDCDVSISATYKLVTYAISVTGGYADKETATPGSLVTVTANVPSGYMFEKWTGEGVIFADVTSVETTFIMPVSAVTIEATFKESSSTTESETESTPTTTQTESEAQKLAAEKETAKSFLSEIAGENPSDEMTKILSDLADALDEAQTVVEVQQIQREGVQAIIAQMQAEAAAAKQAVEDELSQAKKDLAAATASLFEANEALKTANDKITELNNTIQSKDATIAEKQEALDAATEQLNAAKAELETAKTNLETAKAKVTELEGTVSDQDEALKQAKQDLEDKQTALDEMTKNYNETKTALDELKAQVEEEKTNPSETGTTTTDNTLDAAKEAAKAAIDKAAGENLSDEMKTILEDAKVKIDQAKTVDDVNAAKEAGLAAIAEQIARETSATVETLYGDANGDNAINMKDVLLMRKYLADMTDEIDLEASDVNADGTVNMKDVLMLRKYLADMIDKLGA